MFLHTFESTRGPERFALQFAGFEPNIEQSEETKLVMRALLALLPCVCFLIGALLFMRFRLNESDHAEIRETLAQRAEESNGS